MVVPPVGADHEVVVGGKLGVDLGVEVVEPVAEAVEAVDGVAHRPQRRVDVGSPAGNHPRAPAQRPLAHEAAGDQADAAAVAETAAVAVAVLDVENGPEIAAVAGRVGPLVEGDVLDGIRVEGGEEAEGVRRVVEPHLVEQDAGLVGSAAAHVEPAAVIGGRLDARQELQTAQQVGFPHGRHLLQGRHRQDDDARLLAQLVLHPVGRGFDDDGFHPQLLRIQLDIPAQLLAGGEVEGVPVDGVADVGNGDHPGSRRNAGQGVIAFGVAEGAHFPVADRHGGVGQALAVAAVADEAAEGG